MILRRIASLSVVAAWAWCAGAAHADEPLAEWQFVPRPPAAVPAGPPPPDLPLVFAVDDGTSEGDFGVGGAFARQFLWFTQFMAPPGPGATLEEVRVLFDPGANITVGDAIDLVIYQDDDADPSNGAVVLAVVSETIQALDGATFSVYPLATPVEVIGASTILVGVVPRFIVSGSTPGPTLPAAIDASTSDGSAWFATWVADPPDPPNLPSDLSMQPLNPTVAGVWMIRAFGRPLPITAIPTAGPFMLAALAGLLALLGLVLLRRGGMVLVLGLLVLGIAGPARAVVVDDFATAQAALTDPPGTPDASSVAAGLGGERDFFVDRLLGTGTVTAEVTAGALTIGITDTTPDSRGEVVVTWDGVDGDPALDPVGLGGLDLTDDGGVVQTGLRLTTTSADTGVEVTIEVHTDATNASIADLVLLTTQTSYVVAYDAFVQSGSAGPADFSSVGAIEVTIRSTEKAVSVDMLETVPPVIAGLLTDALQVDGDFDTEVDPGDTLRYSLTVSNTGSEADQVDVEDLLSDLTFVPGSVRTTPLAVDDRYDGACGNFTLTVPMGTGVLANDIDLDSNAVAVDVGNSDTASAQGGTVTMSADGSFTYDPPAGFRGIDSFGYQLALVAGDPAPPAPIRGTVTVLVDEIVWFVDDDEDAGGNGTQADPFNRLNEVEAASLPGDTIYVAEDSTPGTVDNLTDGMALKADQRLIGAGVDLVACGQTLVSASTTPSINNVAGNAIDLATDNTIRGLDVRGAAVRGISGSGFGTLSVDTVNIVGGSLEILNLSNGTLAATFGTLSNHLGTASGIVLDSVGGSLDVTTTTITDPVGAGITVDNAPAAADLDFGATTVTLAGGLASAPGVRVSTNAASSTVTFDTLSITTENGAGFLSGIGGTVNINSTAASVNATNGPAVDISATTGRTNGISGWTFATLQSTGSGTDGVLLNNLFENFTVGTSTTVSDADLRGILVSNSANRSIDFGATSVTDTNIGAGANGDGIDLRTGNAGATFTFDSLAATTDGGFGLAANNSGTVNVTSAASTIVATGGPGLDITATTIGINLATLSSSGSPTTGVNLNMVTGTLNATGGAIGTATGNAFDIEGGFGVTTYGGTITNTTNRAVEVRNRSVGATHAITFSGAIDEDGTGILLENIDAVNLRFTGGLDLDTGSNTAFTATAGGSINVCDTTPCGGGAAVTNRIGFNTALSTRAVDIDASTIGADGITFRSIAVDGGTTAAIRLADSGAGTFTVTGDGTTTAGGNGSGGTIENISGSDAIILDNTGGLVTFQNVIVEDISHPSDGGDAIQTRRFADGIHGENVNGGLRLQSVTMRRFSDHAVLGALFSDGTDFTTWNGLELRDSTFENANRFHVAARGDDADEGVIRVRGLTGTVVVDNCTIRLGGRGLDFYTPAGAGTLDVTVQRSAFTDLYKEFAAGGTRNVGGRGASFEARGSHDMVVRIGDPAQANDALGNTFTNNFTASVVVLGQEGGTSPHTGNIDTVISRNDFIITDHTTAQLPFGNLTFDFPQGGVSLNPAGGTYDAIVSHNLFDEVMHAAGGLGQLTLGLNGGAVQAHVHDNEFRLPWDGSVQIRAEGTSSAAVLFEDNIYTDGMVGGATDDVGFATQSPFNPFLVNVRAGGSLDLTLRREVLAQHDIVFTPGDRKHSIELEVQADSAANELDLHLVDNRGPEGYHLKEFNGSFEIFQGVSASTVPATIIDDNGNTGGGSSDLTDPPVVVVDGGVTSTATAPTLPVIVIP